jgi:DNA mismatch repair ATPase MutS
VPIAIVVFLLAEVLFPMSMVAMLRLQIAFAIESWRLRYGKAIGPWLSIVGEYEALCSLAGYSYEHPRDPFPEILEGGCVLDAEELGHPLIPSERCVPNSVRFTDGLQLLVVSGSNMSGKSTFLRTVGLMWFSLWQEVPVRDSDAFSCRR